MQSRNQSASFALVDNWQLELASRLLQQGFSPLSNDTFYNDVGAEREFQAEIAVDQIIALLQFLDLIVLYDELAYDYDPSRSFFWKRTELLQLTKPFLREIRLGSSTEERITDAFQSNIDNHYRHPAWRRTLFYLGLSHLIGADYWPTPSRARYMAQFIYTPVGTGFVYSIKKYIDKNLRDMVDELYTKLNIQRPDLEFPGFGSTILSNCETVESIIPTAVQLRETKEAKTFRAWIKTMDNALQHGDISTISRTFYDLEEIIGEVKKKLRLSRSDNQKIELQIGLSPTVTIDKGLLKDIFDKLRSRPLHIVFLRSHLSRALKSLDVLDQARRLFPEFAEYSPYLHL